MGEEIWGRSQSDHNLEDKIDEKIRIVALSTSLANAEDLGEWIGATSRCVFNFPLDNSSEIHIQGVDVANFEARMQAMTRATYTSIAQHANNGKPSIVFVPTRKHAPQVALDLNILRCRQWLEASFAAVHRRA